MSTIDIKQDEVSQNEVIHNSDNELENVDVVEEEDEYGEDNQEQPIEKPFNPADIDVSIDTVNLGTLIDMLENDEIDLQPEFQRASDLWSLTQKSRLIESILLGLPLPSFYFSEDPLTKKYAIIDGLKRLCAIRDFVLEKENPLRLVNLQFLKEKMEGTTYDELGFPEKRRIKSLKITMNVLHKNTPNEVKFIIFQRVNTAGIPLAPQEMRQALNQGGPATFIRKLAELESFRSATNDSVKSNRMQDRDFANRFVAFYTLGYETYNGELDVYLNSAMEQLYAKSEDELNRIESVFERAMLTCREIFDDDAFRKRHNIRDRKNPISKSLFDTLSVNIAQLSDEQQKALIRKKDMFKEKLMLLFRDDKFNFAISVGTAQKSNVSKRFSEINKLITEVLNDDK